MPDDERDVLARAEAWRRAIVANDAAAIARYTAPEWVLVDQSGVGTRADFLAMVSSAELKHEAMHVVDETSRVRLYGNIAVHTARVTNTAQYAGQQFAADEWTTDIYQRTPDGWVCVHSHVTPASG